MEKITKWSCPCCGCETQELDFYILVHINDEEKKISLYTCRDIDCPYYSRVLVKDISTRKMIDVPLDRNVLSSLEKW